MAANKQEYEKIYMIFMFTAYFILAANIYYYAIPFFHKMGWTTQGVSEIFLKLKKGGMFNTPVRTKMYALLLIFGSHIIRSGKGTEISWWKLGALLAAGLLLYFVFPKDSILYILTTLSGFILCAWTFALISRNMHGFNKDVNDNNETFEQCTEKIETEDSINIPTRYQWKKKMWNGWINVVNPYRATMVLGTPGSGKSFSVYNPFIEQMIDKGYCMFCYDYKFPDLTEVVYNETLRKYPLRKNPDYGKDPLAPQYIKDPEAPEFVVINFKDPRYSNRCNPINARYIEDPADSAEIADIIMKNVAPGTVEKEDFFAMSAKVYLDALIYFLKIYEDGKYCTFPHLIELMAQDYKKVFIILSGYPELETKIKPFASALEAGAQDQLQGQIASAQIPLNKMASPQLYWVLSGDDFSLDLNNPEHPKIICVGNDPDRQAIYGTTLALFTSRMFKLINHKGKRKCGVLLDELPTIFIKGLDNLIATARSNKVAIVLGAQDKSQLIRDYSEKEANVIFNTVGNIFAGQVNGRTAEDLNKSFGREKRMQESQTQNIDSESMNYSFHDEELMPIRKIETLTQGYFFGKVADNNETPIEKKLFCGEILIDMKKFNEKQKTNQKLPIMTDFDDAYYYEQVHEETQQTEILTEYCHKKVQEDEEIYDEDELYNRSIKVFNRLTDDDIEKILRDEAEKRIKSHCNELVQENFKKIREDVQRIVESADIPDSSSQNEYEEEEDEGAEEIIIDPIDEMDRQNKIFNDVDGQGGNYDSLTSF